MRDASRRYESDPADPLLRNLPALWKADPKLAVRAEAADVDSTPVDADSAVVAVAPGTLAVACAGLATAKQAWLATGGDKGCALVVAHEPDDAALAATLAAGDYAEFVASNRVRLFAGEVGAAELDAKVSPFQLLLAGGVARVGDPSRAGFDAFARDLDAVAARGKTNVDTAVAYGRRNALNVLGNLRRYAATSGIGDLAGRFAGRTGVLVSAGPSLRRNIDQLRGQRDRVVIVAVQTALKPLLAAGVEPHFVCTIDHSDLGTRFMEGLPPGLTCRLIADAKANPAVVSAWEADPARRAILLGNDMADSLLRELRLRRATLPGAATVAHLAFEVVQHLGCSTCMLMGQDLGFADGLAYAPGTGYDDAWRPETGRFCTFESKQWEHIARDRHALVRVKDARGNDAYTEKRLAAYLTQFERMFELSPMRTIDATEGGVAKRHAEPMRLADALAIAGDAPLPAMPGEALATPPAGFDQCLANRRDEASLIAEIARQTVPQLELIRARPADARVVNAAIAEIDRLRRPLSPGSDLDATYGLCTLMTQQTERDRVLADLRIKAVDGDALATRRLSADRDLANVRAIEAAAEDLAGLLAGHLVDDARA